MIAGSDKGTIGKVVKVLTKTGEVVVEGVNIKVRLRWQRGGSGKGRRPAGGAGPKCARVAMHTGSRPCGMMSCTASGGEARRALDEQSPSPPSPVQTKHVKPQAQGETGQIVKKEFPVHHSNVQLYSTEKQVGCRGVVVE